MRLKQLVLHKSSKGNDVEQLIQRQLSTAISRIFPCARTVVVSKKRGISILSIEQRTSMAAISHSMCNFICDCDLSYLGRSERYLAVGMGEHILKWLYRPLTQSPDNVAAQPGHKIPASAIAKYLRATCHRINIEQTIEINFAQIDWIFLICRCDCYSTPQVSTESTK